MKLKLATRLRAQPSWMGPTAPRYAASVCAPNHRLDTEGRTRCRPQISNLKVVCLSDGPRKFNPNTSRLKEVSSLRLVAPGSGEWLAHHLVCSPGAGQACLAPMRTHCAYPRKGTRSVPLEHAGTHAPPNQGLTCVTCSNNKGQNCPSARAMGRAESAAFPPSLDSRFSRVEVGRAISFNMKSCCNP